MYIIFNLIIFLVVSLVGMGVNYRKLNVFPMFFSVLIILYNSFFISDSGGLIDYQYYQNFYESYELNISFLDFYMNAMDMISSNELLFVLSMYISNLFTLSFFDFTFIFSLIFLFLLRWGYSRLERDWFLCFIALFSTASFVFLYGNTLRQAMSIPFVLLFISSTDRKQFKEALLFFVFAVFSHYSSIMILLPFIGFKVCKIFLVNKKNKTNTLVILFVFGLGIALNYFGLLNAILIKFSFYLSDTVSLSNLISITFFSNILIVFILVFLKSKKIYINEDSLFSFYIIISAISTMFIFNEVIYNRITLFRTVIEVVILLRIFKCFKFSKTNGRVFYPFFVVLYFIYNVVISPAYKIFY